MARCASCSYPLTIIDSIVCYECSSYFHIDCAQLVGFPYYELSSDPNRNTFHCATCKILPLPRRRSDSDSDSDTEPVVDSTMPSRQLDYQLEGEADLAKNLCEVQGSVQDLSDLCKDMLREINELKSINLTLRCCIENLRQDNEKRDCVISELKYRLDALERNKTSNRINSEGPNWDANIEGEPERYLTPEPECPRIEEVNTSFSKAYDTIIPHTQSDNYQRTDELLQRILPEGKSNYEDDEGDNEEEEVPQNVKTSSQTSETENETEPSEREEELLYSEETFSSDASKEHKAEELIDSQQRRKDWDWKGTRAVEIENLGDEEESEEEESESETSQGEGEQQGWEILKEEVDVKVLSKPNRQSSELVDDFWSSKQEEEEEDEEEDEETEKEDELWKERLEMRDTKQVWEKGETDKTSWITEGTEGSVVEQRTTQHEKESTYDSEGEEAADATQDQESSVQEDTAEEGAEKKEEGEGQLPGEGDGEKLPEGVEGEITAEGATVLEGEPRLEGDEEVRLEGEAAPQATSEGEQGVEGEQLGGQSPEEGEVQPTEPQPPPVPQHTEEDLWLYLKETVTSVHPATVEEFVQNLIGTLQQVPEEYLIPVIDANIKRAASPCVFDGEQPLTQEGAPLAEGQEAPADGSAPAEGGATVAGEIPEVLVTSEAGDAVPEVSPEVPVDPAPQEEGAEGFSAVEGALLGGGFWVMWLLYTAWNT